MQKPPFKLAAAIRLPLQGLLETSEDDAGPEDSPSANGSSNAHDHAEGDASAVTPIGRARLAELDPHLHCSVIGTCLSTADLRKLMARFLFVRDSSDLEVHHEAVEMTSRGGLVTKAIQKALDKRHEAALQRFAKARGVAALGTLWDEALAQGEVPGAYWAVLTHRDTTAELRQRVFGDVHMLSHLVGAANRADIRRLVALERENAELRERSDRQQLRLQEALDEHQRRVDRLEAQLAQVSALATPTQALSSAAAPSAQLIVDERAAAANGVALQTERRERAEQTAAVALDDAMRLREELDHLGQHAESLARELAAAEIQLREIGAGAGEQPAPGRALAAALGGKRVFYVGGRPSSATAIRDLVLRHGGEFQRHDGGLEDRKGLLAAGVAWAQCVVFPVDCIDHDSAGNLKRLCARQQVEYLPLRSASVASFAAAFLAGLPAPAVDESGRQLPPPICRKHG